MATIIDTGDPRAVAAVEAIHDGDIARLRHLLAQHPELAAAALGAEGPNNGMTRSLLHVATDWPGHYPNGARTVALLAALRAGEPLARRADSGAHDPGVRDRGDPRDGDHGAGRPERRSQGPHAPAYLDEPIRAAGEFRRAASAGRMGGAAADHRR